jgi:predicted RNA polymerase sigma factor
VRICDHPGAAELTVPATLDGEAASLERADRVACAVAASGEARPDARAVRQLVLLDEQGRARGDAAKIERATLLPSRALRLGPPGRDVLQAAIASSRPSTDGRTRS